MACSAVREKEEHEEAGWLDGVAILAAVALVVMVSSINDWKKERQFRSLQNRIDSDHTYTVLRAGGELVQLPVSDLVVGDICLVKYGRKPRSHVELSPGLESWSRDVSRLSFNVLVLVSS